MSESDLIDRLTDAPGSSGDRLKEIIEGKTGDDVGRLRARLTALWTEANKPKGDESVQRMKARNVAIKLAKGVDVKGKAKPRRAVVAYQVLMPSGEALRLSFCLMHYSKLCRDRPNLKVVEIAGKAKGQCEACGFKRNGSEGPDDSRNRGLQLSPVRAKRRAKGRRGKRHRVRRSREPL